MKLIELEVRKHKLTGMLKGIIICNLLILAFMSSAIFIDFSEIEPAFTSYTQVFEGLYVFVKAAYIIFAAVLISKLIIDEYRNNTITLLFMYPISRKKLMAAKLIIVFVFTLVNIIVADVGLGMILLGINSFANVIPGEPTLAVITSQLGKIGLDALFAAGTSLIPLFFGMRKQSVSATIVSAVLIVAFFSSGANDFRLSNLTFVMAFLSLLGVGAAYLWVHTIERKDIA